MARSAGANRRGGALIGLLLVAPPVLIVAGLILLPAATAALSTLRVGVGDQAVFSLANYVQFFSDPQSTTDLAYTIWTTLITTALLIAVCLPLALYLRFASGPLAAVVQSIAVFPLFVPAIVVCYALIRYMGPNGLLQTFLSRIGISGYSSPYLTAWGPVVGLFWEGIPLTLLILLSGLGAVSTSAIEAARDVGAGPLRILFIIVIPLIKRSLLVAFALDVLSIFGAFTTPYLLGPAAPEMLGVLMQRTFWQVRDTVQAETQAVVSFAICAAVGILYVRAIARSRRGAAS
jgi:putative spermidine/putrescine transport system permease protein